MEATCPYAIKKWIWKLNHQLTILSRPTRGHQGSSQELENLEKNEKFKSFVHLKYFLFCLVSLINTDISYVGILHHSLLVLAIPTL